MSLEDPELRRLLIAELGRHMPALTAPSPDAEAVRRAVHALKGSAGLAGEKALSEVLQRLEKRIREEDPSAVLDAAHVVGIAIERLSRGEGATSSSWPEPPDDMTGRVVDAAARAQYRSEILDHLASIDRELASVSDPVEAALTVYRHVHTIKGAAGSVGDDALSWFCHGLEERLKPREPSVEAAGSILAEMARWRSHLSGLVEDPEGALRSLRGPESRDRASRFPSRRPSTRPPDSTSHREEAASSQSSQADEATIRVSALSVDRLLDKVAAVGVVRERIAGRIESSREQSKELRRLRGDLAEALRLIGPPRPWGAPAAALRRIEWTATALHALVEELDHAAVDLRSGDQALRENVAEAKQHLSAMRQTPLKRLFARLSTAIESEARRGDRTIIVRTRGADETVDRRVAELLVEPCLQLARNAVAHGIESPEVRRARGKQEAGTISLTARRAGPRLSITIEDDGAGVDVGLVRERAVSAGVLAPHLAEAADDNTLLALLFLPGFSTRETSDLLAGRGIGLDITLGSVQRVGGAIRLSSRHGEGFSARLDIPVESGLASVLWVTAAGDQYAIPVAHARKVLKIGAHDDDRTPHLASCLEAKPSVRAPFAIEIDDGTSQATPGRGPHQAGGGDQDHRAFRVGVDEVGQTEETLIRPLTSLVATMGPFSGAIVRGDGSLRLALDVFALAPRARTLGRLPDRPSAPPARNLSQPPPRLA